MQFFDSMPERESFEINSKEIPKAQGEIIAELASEWQRNTENRAIGIYIEAAENGELVRRFGCQDARDNKNTPSAVKNRDVPMVDPIKGIAGYPRPNLNELLYLANGAGIIETTSHLDSGGLVSGSSEDESVCGGEAEKFGYYGNPAYRFMAEHEFIDQTGFNDALAGYNELQGIRLLHEGIPGETGKAVLQDVFWARSRESARSFWGDYVYYQGVGPSGAAWKDNVVEGILDNLGVFRDSDNLALDATVRAWVYANFLKDEGVESLVVTTALSNHRVQASVPLALIDLRQKRLKLHLPNGNVFSDEEFSRFGNVIKKWGEITRSSGQLVGLDMNQWPDSLVERYYRYASEVKDSPKIKEATASQGNFGLYIDAASIPAMTFAGRRVKHGAAFGGRLLGENQIQLSYRSRNICHQLGYGEHLDANSLTVFSDSKAEAQAILDFIFQKSWGSNFRNKDNVVAMVVTGQNDMQERRLYGTTIKNGDVELIDAYV